VSAQTCDHPLRSGDRCHNPVGPATTRCAAGHPAVRDDAGRLRSGACDLAETGTGWVCKTHDLESEEWQVLLVLGARPPCQVPGPVAGRRKIAADKKAKPGTLSLLSWDEDGTIRYWVALNPNTPASVLERLVGDKDERVRCGVVGNPSTPATILERLARDGNMQVRGGVARNRSAPASALERLARDENKTVRGSVAENPSTPANILEQLAKDENMAVRYWVAGNPSTPASALE